MKITSFPPIAAPKAIVLILGSMPGKKSLFENEYYAHPRNAFWDMIAEIFGISRELAYQTRCQKLAENGIALWDVLKHCEREGSLDSSIQADTEIPNEFEEFLEAHAGIQNIFFNGQKAEKSFRKLVWPKLSQELQGKIKLATLPSTSPANARLSKDLKCAAWKKHFDGILG